MIKFRIKALMAERGIKKPRIKLLVQRGMSHNIAQNYLNGKKQDIARKDIEIFCTLLRCEPNDLFEYIPDSDTLPLDKDHPLHKIKPKAPLSLEDIIKNMTAEELRDFMEKRKKEEEEKKKKDKDDDKKK